MTGWAFVWDGILVVTLRWAELGVGVFDFLRG